MGNEHYSIWALSKESHVMCTATSRVVEEMLHHSKMTVSLKSVTMSSDDWKEYTPENRHALISSISAGRLETGQAYQVTKDGRGQIIFYILPGAMFFSLWVACTKRVASTGGDPITGMRPSVNLKDRHKKRAKFIDWRDHNDDEDLGMLIDERQADMHPMTRSIDTLRMFLGLSFAFGLITLYYTVSMPKTQMQLLSVAYLGLSLGTGAMFHTMRMTEQRLRYIAGDGTLSAPMSSLPVYAMAAFTGGFFFCLFVVLLPSNGTRWSPGWYIPVVFMFCMLKFTAFVFLTRFRRSLIGYDDRRV